MHLGTTHAAESTNLRGQRDRLIEQVAQLSKLREESIKELERDKISIQELKDENMQLKNECKVFHKIYGQEATDLRGQCDRLSEQVAQLSRLQEDSFAEIELDKISIKDLKEKNMLLQTERDQFMKDTVSMGTRLDEVLKTLELSNSALSSALSYIEDLHKEEELEEQGPEVVDGIVE